MQKEDRKKTLRVLLVALPLPENPETVSCSSHLLGVFSQQGSVLATKK